jgi:hypothetical protein
VTAPADLPSHTPHADGEHIPVIETPPATARPAETPTQGDWTRTDRVRDDPGTLSEEARNLWGAVRDQFVEPLLRDYPGAAGHLTTAGTELAAALRALVRGAERRWMDSGAARPEDGRDSPRDN